MLKLLACLFMLLDHIGYYFAFALDDNLVVFLRSIGRLAFPIFAWSVARGFTRTRNPLRYFVRMSIFAVLTEICFRFAHKMAGITMHSTNVMVTFAFAIVFLTGYRMACHSCLDMIASLRPISPTPHTLPTLPRFDVRINIGGIELDRRIGLPLGLTMMMLSAAGVMWLKPDYGLYGLFTVWIFYAVHDFFPEKEQERRATQGFIILNLLFLIIRAFTHETPFDWALLQCLSVVAVPICYLLNKEQRPTIPAKYAFYLFYPVHILILLGLRILLWPK